MKFPPLLEGRLLRRYKRFFVDVELDDGSVVTAHCANTGSMKTCLGDETRVWLSAARAGRKLPYTWEVAETDQCAIYVNPARANDVVAEAIADGRVPELGGYDALEREVSMGEGSRVDIVLTRFGERCFVEVKNVTLTIGDGRSSFPDAVTTRGTKHLGDLTRMVELGHRAVLFFCASRSDTRSVEPADHIDAVYGAALRRAVAAGVEVLSYTGDISREGFWLTRRVPVHL